MQGDPGCAGPSSAPPQPPPPQPPAPAYLSPPGSPKRTPTPPADPPSPSTASTVSEDITSDLERRLAPLDAHAPVPGARVAGPDDLSPLPPQHDTLTYAHAPLSPPPAHADLPPHIDPSPLPPPAPRAADAPPPPGPPPPTYAPTQPQILVTPLPDAPGFFWGHTLQGEVFVKGLGQASTQAVKSLTVTARLTDSLPGRPDIALLAPSEQVLYPPPHASSSGSADPSRPFPSAHRFLIPLPASLDGVNSLPGTLELGPGGAVRWTLHVRLALASGEVLAETIGVEGTPPDPVDPVGDVDDAADEADEERQTVLERDGVHVRLVVATERPRLGDALHFGIEVRPKQRARVGLAGLVAQGDPDETLRSLRRVRVDLVRHVDLARDGGSDVAEAAHPSPQPPAGDQLSPTRTHTALPPPRRGSTSTTMSIGSGADANTLTSIVCFTGKLLRYPGSGHPPLRLLFTLPTVTHNASGNAPSAHTPYHTVRFAVRVALGIAGGEWTVEHGLTVRPPAWREPRTVLIERGLAPALGDGSDARDVGALPDDDEDAREAYRRKGRDVVGETGTMRVDVESGAPPPFEYDAGPVRAFGSFGGGPTADEAGPAGPSGSHTSPIDDHTDSGMHAGPPPPPHAPAAQDPDTSDTALPTFTESEAQMRSGVAPMLAHVVPSQRLVPVNFDEFAIDGEHERRGELASWVEYDGYETFSMAPPPVAASFGVTSSIDPPSEAGEDAGVVGGMAARLGLDPGADDPAALMARIGLGARVVDMHDDMPPGIDEPSLPALPGFSERDVNMGMGGYVGMPPPSIDAMPIGSMGQIPMGMDPMLMQGMDMGQLSQLGQLGQLGHPLNMDLMDGDHPPSFAASEAAEAAGGVARSRMGVTQHTHAHTQHTDRPAHAHPHPHARSAHGHAHPHPHDEAEAPPGYFGGGAGGPPAYS